MGLYRRSRVVKILLFALGGCSIWSLFNISLWSAVPNSSVQSNSINGPLLRPMKHDNEKDASKSMPTSIESVDQLDLETFRDRWLRYRPPVQSGVKTVGKPFHVGESRPKWISSDYVTLTSQTTLDFVIATAASRPFYRISLSAIETVQRHLPNHRIIVYDLEPLASALVAAKFRDVCGVEYRSFNFSQYPKHVEFLENYAWKPLIIAELLSEFPGVFWIDSSIRFTTSDFSQIFSRAIRSDGIMTLSSTGHSNYAVTHNLTYDYLPTSTEAMISTDQHEANCVLIYRTRPAIEHVLWWWRLCALEPLCIAPTTRRMCIDPYKSRNRWAFCHRFDQSALNILLANYFAFDSMRYYGAMQVLVVERHSVSRGRIKICGGGGGGGGGGRNSSDGNTSADILDYMRHLYLLRK